MEKQEKVERVSGKCSCGWELPVNWSISAYIEDPMAVPEIVTISLECPRCHTVFDQESKTIQDEERH